MSIIKRLCVLVIAAVLCGGGLVHPARASAEVCGTAAPTGSAGYASTYPDKMDYENTQGALQKEYPSNTQSMHLPAGDYDKYTVFVNGISNTNGTYTNDFILDIYSGIGTDSSALLCSVNYAQFSMYNQSYATFDLPTLVSQGGDYTFRLSAPVMQNQSVSLAAYAYPANTVDMTYCDPALNMTYYCKINFVKLWNSQDSAAPDTALVSPTTPYLTQRNPAVSFTSSSGTTKAICQVDNRAAYKCVSGGTLTFEEGAHTLSIAAIDDEGRIDPTPATTQFIVDVTPPVVSYSLSGPSGRYGWQLGDTTVNWQATDYGSYGVGSGFDTLPTTLVTAEGTTTVTENICDRAGNCTTGSATISIDKTPPVVTNAVLSSRIIKAGQKYTIRADVSDQVSGMGGDPTGEYFVDTDPGLGNAQLIFLNNDSTGLYLQREVIFPNKGTYTAYIRAKDIAGNWGLPTSVVVNVH